MVDYKVSLENVRNYVVGEKSVRIISEVGNPVEVVEVYWEGDNFKVPDAFLKMLYASEFKNEPMTFTILEGDESDDENGCYIRVSSGIMHVEFEIDSPNSGFTTSSIKKEDLPVRSKPDAKGRGDVDSNSPMSPIDIFGTGSSTNDPVKLMQGKLQPILARLPQLKFLSENQLMTTGFQGYRYLVEMITLNTTKGPINTATLVNPETLKSFLKPQLEKVNELEVSRYLAVVASLALDLDADAAEHLAKSVPEDYIGNYNVWYTAMNFLDPIFYNYEGTGYQEDVIKSVLGVDIAQGVYTKLFYEYAALGLIKSGVADAIANRDLIDLLHNSKVLRVSNPKSDYFITKLLASLILALDENKNNTQTMKGTRDRVFFNRSLSNFAVMLISELEVFSRIKMNTSNDAESFSMALHLLGLDVQKVEVSYDNQKSLNEVLQYCKEMLAKN